MLQILLMIYKIYSGWVKNWISEEVGSALRSEKVYILYVESIENDITGNKTLRER